MTAHPGPLPPDFPQDPPPGGLTSGVMTSKKFIGAVEDEWILFSDRASDYIIGDPIGYGASSIVYAATYHPPAKNPNNPPTPTPCALKVLDLDSLPPRSLQLLKSETTLMSLSKHPNVLRVRGSWMEGHKLYIALRLMNKGSAADVMRYGWPGGMEEDVVKCILRQALKGLNYLHINGFIHRDVKAANLLIDDDGTVLLGDLGVAADLSEDPSRHTSTNSHSREYTVTTTAAPNQAGHKHSVAFDGGIKSRPKIGKRKSFVGTPCWMAPELIQGRQYDSGADIWSFGITALELCQGRPPRSRESPKDVLLRVIHDAPPTLDREGGAYKYSRAFKEMVDSCLVKDPSKRPTAEQLLQTPFFKSAKKKSYLINTILKDLPPLTRRQERRAVRHPPTVATIDSWDFATTVHSPASTIHHRRRPLEDFTAHELGSEKQENVSDSEGYGDLVEGGERPSTTPSSSEDDASTEAPEHGTSTPPTTTSSSFVEPPPSPKLPTPTQEPAVYAQSPLTPEGKGTKKKKIWSRIISNAKKPSFLGSAVPSAVSYAGPSTGIGRSSGRHDPKPAILGIQEVRGGSQQKTLINQVQELRNPTMRPKTSDTAPGVFKMSSDGVSATDGISPGSWGRIKGMELMKTLKAKRPGTRGSIVEGVIGEARSKLSIS